MFALGEFTRSIPIGVDKTTEFWVCSQLYKLDQPLSLRLEDYPIGDRCVMVESIMVDEHASFGVRDRLEFLTPHAISLLLDSQITDVLVCVCLCLYVIFFLGFFFCICFFSYI